MTVGLIALLRERLALLPGAVLSPAAILLRDVTGGLGEPGRESANRHCRLMRAQDGWVALNLARPDDAELIPALTSNDGDGWEAVERFAGHVDAGSFVTCAAELQLPAAGVGETSPAELASSAGSPPRRVLDLSALWAGPLCAALLARAGATVLRIDSARRLDPTPSASPALDRFLNHAKDRLTLDFADPMSRERLHGEIHDADVLVTSARAGALARLGLDRETLASAHPRLIWVAITAHGWTSDRVGFGDDCAAAGGLVRWERGEPRFLGDALADPLTGVEAALLVFERAGEGRGGMIDVALAEVAAAYASRTAP